MNEEPTGSRAGSLGVEGPEECKAPDCSRPVRTAGLCGMHYQRMWAHGTLDKPLRKGPPKASMDAAVAQELIAATIAQTEQLKRIADWLESRP